MKDCERVDEATARALVQRTVRSRFWWAHAEKVGILRAGIPPIGPTVYLPPTPHPN